MKLVLTQNSKFNPYSFERLLQPLAMYTQEYNAVEEGISELATKAELMKQYAQEAPDSKAARMYEDYSKSLKSQADDLAKNGLAAVNRSNLMNLRTQYQSSIAPIETAVVRRRELADEQRKLRAANSKMIFDNDFSTLNLDELIANPSLGYTPLNGEDVVKASSSMAKQAAESVINDPEYTSVYRGQYVQQKLSQGYSIEDIILASKNDPNAPEALKNIYSTIRKQFDYDSWSLENKSKIDSYIDEGIYAASETSKFDVMANRSYMTELERERLQLANELSREQINQLKGEEIPGGGRVVKLGGGKFVQYDKDGNIVYSNAVTTTPEQKAAQEAKADLDKTLSSVVKVSDMKGTGYNPVGVVALISGNWVGGREGEDIPGTWKGATRTNLKEESARGHRFYDPVSWFTGSGNFSYTPYDPNTEASVVTNPETIPGFKEWLSGEGAIENSAFAQILEQAKRAGISDEEFMSDNIQIVQVKGKRSRKGSDTPYDYIIYRKS